VDIIIFFAVDHCYITDKIMDIIMLLVVDHCYITDKIVGIIMLLDVDNFVHFVTCRSLYPHSSILYTLSHVIMFTDKLWI